MDIIPLEKEDSKDVFSEDFIIIENPEFSQRPTTLQPSHPHIQLETGVETILLPPPRTLDDAPIRSRKRKDRSFKGKRPKKVNEDIKTVSESSETVIDVTSNGNPEYSSNQSKTVSHAQSENEIQNSLLPQALSLENINSDDENHVLSMTMTEITEKSVADSSDSIVEDVRSTSSYNLRKKPVSVDYSRDFMLLANEEEYLVDRSFSCPECLVCCETKKELKRHQVAMHGHEEYQCDECGNDFTTALGLRKHTFLKHRKTKCSHCGKQFKVGHALLNHMKVCGGQSVSGSSRYRQKPKYFPCPKCGKKFSERGNLRRHVKLHEGFLEFSCDHCGKKCSEKQALESHIRYMHSGERPYKCNKCTKSFVTNSDWNRHQSVHSDTRKFSCSDCGKAFKTREALKSHMKLKNGEKLWQCGVCNLRFITRGGLKTHMVVHSSIKMYECETCQRQFSHKGSLEAHMRVHTGLMPYVCPKCGKKFAHLQNRNRHVRTMHPGDP